MHLLTGLAAVGLVFLTGAGAAAQVESEAGLQGTWAIAFTYGAGGPHLPHVGSIDLELHPEGGGRFTGVGLASPGGFALLGGWLGWKTRPGRAGQRTGAFLAAGPTIEMGNVGARLAAAARAGGELLVSPGVRVRIEARGLAFATDEGAGRGAVLALVGLRAGGGS